MGTVSVMKVRSWQNRGLGNQVVGETKSLEISVETKIWNLAWKRKGL